MEPLLLEMEENQPVVLYDFLYRDDARLASYYAQIFSGRLSGLEETNQERNNKETLGKATLSVFGQGVGVDRKHVGETTTVFVERLTLTTRT